MKQPLIPSGRTLLLLFCLVFCLPGISPAAEELRDIIELPVEIHEQLKRKLKDSREYTEEQLASINRCLERGNVKGVINCLSDDGLEDALEIGYIIRDEMSHLRDRICGSDSHGDRCKKARDDVKHLGSSIQRWGTQLQEKWSQTVAGGKAYLDQRYELTRLKKKICDRINQEGCWNWLNERLDLNCKPKDLGHDPERLKQCRLEVARDVWQRLEARQ